MVKKLLSSAFLLLSGCGFYPVSSTYIDPEFIPFVMEYKEDKLRFLKTSEIVRISMTFKTLDEAGACQTQYYSNRVTKTKSVFSRHIFIDPKTWFSISDTSKKNLIYHELGHCDLGAKHSDSYTLMHPWLINDAIYNMNPEYYISLLFNEKR